MNLSLLDPAFLGLLVAVIALRAVAPARAQGVVGALASAALIGFASLSTLVLIGGIAVFYLYPLVLLIRARKVAGGQAAAKPWLIGGIVGLIALLVLYKTERAFTVPLFSGSPLGNELLAVVGLSYFFYKALNVLHMHYLVDMEERSPFTILYFALFPPTLTSGPMQKYVDFRQQVAAPRAMSMDDIYEGAYRITRGFFRKLCLVYFLDLALDELYALPPTVYLSLLILVTMYLLLYFDFAGYSDIAIGFGLLLGIRVPENFKEPFRSTTITEFWRNWHITLADAQRDLMFIPSGGMRLSRLGAGTLAFMIMVLCGLWHGFTLPFIAWGVYHGLILLLEAVTGSRPMPPGRRHGPRYWRMMLWTNARVAAGCIFFLPDGETMNLVLNGFTKWW